MDTALPVLLDSELASEMVRLLGEELKKTRGRLRAAEEELAAAREREGCCAVNMLPALHTLLALPSGQLSAREMLVRLASVLKTLRDGLQEARTQSPRARMGQAVTDLQAQLRLLAEEKDQITKEKQHIVAHLEEANEQPKDDPVAELREAVRARDEELVRTASVIAALRDELEESSGKVRACDEMAHERQRVNAGLTETNAQLKGEITALRREALGRETELSKKAELHAALQKQLEEQGATLCSYEESKKSLEALMHRAESERDQACAARTKAINGANARTRACTAISKERDSYKALAEKYKADAEKAEGTIKRYGWHGQYTAFVKMVQDFSQPATVPPLSKLRPCMTCASGSSIPRVARFIQRVYDPRAIFYLDDVPVWLAGSRHGFAVVPVHVYGAAPGHAEWTANTARDDVHAQVHELFYRAPKGAVVYAGTYKLIKGPALAHVAAPDYARLRLPADTAERLARDTVKTSERSGGMLDAIAAQYAKGLLPVGMIGLQCVGYKEGFDAALREWTARKASTDANNASTAADPNSDSELASVKSEPEGRCGLRAGGLPAKRKSEAQAVPVVDFRKRPKMGAGRVTVAKQMTRAKAAPGRVVGPAAKTLVNPVKVIEVKREY